MTTAPQNSARLCFLTFIGTIVTSLVITGYDRIVKRVL